LKNPNRVQQFGKTSHFTKLCFYTPTPPEALHIEIKCNLNVNKAPKEFDCDGEKEAHLPVD
jgi:hypothetical protein